MLATRIIPTLLCRGSALFKGERFNAWRQVGHARQAVRIHQSRGVDELILLDIAATPEGRGPDISMIQELSDECFSPLTVGGGVRDVEDVRELLIAGADKVSIGSHPEVIRPAAEKFGSQAIVASVDAIKYADSWLVRCNCHTSTILGANPSDWSRRLQDAGAGEILLTSIDREGTLQGYDIDLISTVASAVNIPVIAHGGCGTYEHMYEAIQAGASAVAAGAMFQFTDHTPKGAAQYLASKGVEVRL